MLALALLPLLASSAVAHFTVQFPAATRGFDEDKMVDFCGGFPTSATRQPFPLGPAPVWIDSGHKATIHAFVSTSNNPTAPTDFNATANGTAIPIVTDAFSAPAGNACWNVDFSSLNLGLVNGSEVTLLIQYNGGDSTLFQCTDLVLLSNYTVPENRTCTHDASKAPADNTTGHDGHGTNTTTGGNSTASDPATSKPGAAASLSAGGLFAVLAVAAAALF